MQNNNTQPQAFYTKMPSAVGNSSGNNSTSNNNLKPSSRKKSHLKMIIGVFVLLIVLIGSGAGFYLSQQNQDLRQQASEGVLAELNRCEPCVDPSSGGTIDAVCSAGLICKTTVSETCSTPTDGTTPICTSVQSTRGVCLAPGEENSVCTTTTDDNNYCVTSFSIPKGDAICESKIAQADFTPLEGVTEVVEIFEEPGSFNVGDTFIFSITVTASDDTDGDVVVTDELPSNLSFIDDPDNTPGIIVSTQTVSLNLGEMTKDQTTKVEFMVEVISTEATTSTNSAKVITDSTTPTESVCSYSYDTSEGAAECVSKEMYDIDPSDPDAELIPAGSALVRGEEYVYYITVNATNKTNGEVKIYDVVPEGLEIIRALTDNVQNISDVAGENTILANLGVLENEEATFGFVVRVTDEISLGDLNNSALVYIYPPDSDTAEPAENGSICEISHSILPIGTAQCIEKEAFVDFDGTEIEAGEIVDPGQEFVYRISVQADDTTTGNVVVIDELSTNLIFVEDPDNTEGVEYDSDTREVSFDFGIIEDTEINVLEFKVQIIASPIGDTVDNSATITTDEDTSHVCEITLLLEEDEEVEEEYACNESCTSNEDCQSVNINYICHDSTIGFVCRLDDNLESTTCDLAGISTPTPTPVVTPAPGCNDLCSTNADCSNSSHVCTTIDDGSNRCRLDNYPDSETCTPPLAEQPVLPETLPETGPADWLNWLKAGMVTLGVGTALLLLL